MREPRFVAVPCRKKAPKVSAEGLSGRLRTGFSERLPDDHALLDGMYIAPSVIEKAS